MPEIARFYGIVILLHWEEHPPPHFHARYAEWEASIAIDTLQVEGGSLPRRALRLVIEWAASHQQELMDDWQHTQQGLAPKPILPLK